MRRRRAGREAHGSDLVRIVPPALSEDATAPRRKKGLEGVLWRCVGHPAAWTVRKIALLQVRPAASKPASRTASPSRSAIAELMVRSSFRPPQRRGALFDAVEKSNRFGFMFVITIESPDRWISPKARRAVLGAWIGSRGPAGPDARALLLEADLSSAKATRPRGAASAGAAAAASSNNARPRSRGPAASSLLSSKMTEAPPAWASAPNRAASSKMTGVGFKDRRRSGPRAPSVRRPRHHQKSRTDPAPLRRRRRPRRRRRWRNWTPQPAPRRRWRTAEKVQARPVRRSRAVELRWPVSVLIHRSRRRRRRVPSTTRRRPLVQRAPADYSTSGAACAFRTVASASLINPVELHSSPARARANASASANFFAFSATKARATQTNAKLSPTRCRAIASKTASGVGARGREREPDAGEALVAAIARVIGIGSDAALAEAVPVGVGGDRVSARRAASGSPAIFFTVGVYALRRTLACVLCVRASPRCVLEALNVRAAVASFSAAGPAISARSAARSRPLRCGAAVRRLVGP